MREVVLEDTSWRWNLIHSTFKWRLRKGGVSNPNGRLLIGIRRIRADRAEWRAYFLFPGSQDICGPSGLTRIATITRLAGEFDGCTFSLKLADLEPALRGRKLSCRLVRRVFEAVADDRVPRCMGPFTSREGRALAHHLRRVHGWEIVP